MLLRKIIGCTGIVVFFGVSAISKAEVFEYTKQMHGVTQAQCEEYASGFAARVARLSGGVATSVFCAAKHNSYADLSVFVDIPVLPNLETAVFAFNVVPAPNRSNAINRAYIVLDLESAYQRLDHCLAALPTHEAKFAGQTGLEPVSSQCVKENEFTYIAQVDGFGSASKHFYDLSFDLGNGSATNKMYTEVGDYLRSIGIESVYNGPLGSYLKLKYYAPAEIKLRAYDFAEHNRFVTESDCEQAVNQVNQIFASHPDLKLASLSCNLGQLSGGQKFFTMISVLDLTGRTSEAIPLRIQNMGRYTTAEACEVARVNVEGSYCAANLDGRGSFRGYDLNKIQ